MTTASLVENFFRHEYGKLVAILSRRIGVQHNEDIEDAVQAALVSAIQTWPLKGQPDKPTAWLYRVALNKLLDNLRKDAGRKRILDRNTIEFTTQQPQAPESFLDDEIKDDLLRMLFVCCDDAIPTDSQLAIALKTLCGFEVNEISLLLFTSEANVYKRLSRARSRLRKTPFAKAELNEQQFSSRLPTVHKVLYLLFSEGHLSSNPQASLRRELCEEAIRLGEILIDSKYGNQPETFALLALMQLHLARFQARNEGTGGLLLLEEQDRSLWEAKRIQLGLRYLAQSAQGERFSRYHAEAGIAAEHCLASTFSATRWERIVNCYELLENVVKSPIHTLNRAIAMAEWQGPEQGLSILEAFEAPSWLSSSYQWTATMADLHRRCGNPTSAAHYHQKALLSAPSEAVRDLLKRRLNSQLVRNTAPSKSARKPESS